jgi:putative hydrolase
MADDAERRETDSTNALAARLFREYADLLALQEANPFRVNAWRRGASTLEALDRDVRDLLEAEGTDGLVELPGIGEGLASAIGEIARTGRLSQLDRLRGEAEPEQLLQSVPGIGPRIAHEIHEMLDVDSLEALEIAAHDGRLEKVEGVGKRRAAAIRGGLAEILGRSTARRRSTGERPSVDLLLDIDRRYRQKASAGELDRIAPKRFNPEGKSWLPIMHADRDGWHFTALYSNTARAHDLGKTDDWVVIYYYDGDHHEGQCTVVTETHGKREGERVIRGREVEGSR